MESYKAVIKKIDIPSNHRVIVISDIHGNLNALKKLLQKVSFSENDYLIIDGDFTEKGPESLKTLRFIMDLKKKYNVYAVIGNVDFTNYILACDDREEEGFSKFVSLRMNTWGKSLYLDMFKEGNIVFDPNGDMKKYIMYIRNNYKDEIEFLKNLPTVIETSKYIFVHAGLPDCTFEKMKDHNIKEFIKISSFMNQKRCFNKYVVVGHWPVTLYRTDRSYHNPIIDKERKVISIDGGCVLKDDGQLNALIINDINSEDFEFTSYDDLKIAQAIDSQKESQESIYIPFTDNNIKVLKREDEFSYIEHNSTGTKLWMLNDYIYDWSDDARCDDYTNYRHEIKPGDVISVLRKTSKGYMIKKDGVSGWYSGEVNYL